MTTLDDIMTELKAIRSRLDCPSRPAKLLTLDEAAAFVNVSTGTIRRWVKDGRLENKGHGRALRFALDDLKKARE